MELRERISVNNGLGLRWIFSADEIARLAIILEEADALLFGCDSMRQAFLQNVRFDVAADAPVEEGLSLASLELQPAEQTALRFLRRLPSWLFHVARIERQFAAKTRALVRSASAIVVGLAPDWNRDTDFAVGRLMERTWLALTRRGLAVQPLMSLSVLDNAAWCSAASEQSGLLANKTQAVLKRFREACPALGLGRIAFILRGGMASPPAGRTGRRPVDRCLRVSD
jgi:hypothetical protein